MPLPKPAESRAPRANPDVKCGRRAMAWQVASTGCDGHASLAGTWVPGEAVPVCAEGTWESSAPSSQLCYEPKTALNINSISRRR